jgi:hypothetical protein
MQIEFNRETGIAVIRGLTPQVLGALTSSDLTPLLTRITALENFVGINKATKLITFNDRASGDLALTGVYDTVDWGNQLLKTYEDTNGKYLYYNRSSANVAQSFNFTLPTGSTFKSVRVKPLSGATGTITIASSGNTNVVTNVTGTDWIKITTNWTTIATVVTITVLTSTAIYNFAFDDFEFTY